MFVFVTLLLMSRMVPTPLSSHFTLSPGLTLNKRSKDRKTCSFISYDTMCVKIELHKVVIVQTSFVVNTVNKNYLRFSLVEHHQNTATKHHQFYLPIK